VTGVAAGAGPRLSADLTKGPQVVGRNRGNQLLFGHCQAVTDHWTVQSQTRSALPAAGTFRHGTRPLLRFSLS